MIKLDQLSYEQLIELNHAVVARLKYLNALKTLDTLTNLHIGQRVCFDHHAGILAGRIIKINQKTVIVHTDDHRSWKVSPTLLKPVLEETLPQYDKKI